MKKTHFAGLVLLIVATLSRTAFGAGMILSPPSPQKAQAAVGVAEKFLGETSQEIDKIIRDKSRGIASADGDEAAAVGAFSDRIKNLATRLSKVGSNVGRFARSSAANAQEYKSLLADKAKLYKDLRAANRSVLKTLKSDLDAQIKTIKDNLIAFTKQGKWEPYFRNSWKDLFSAAEAPEVSFVPDLPAKQTQMKGGAQVVTRPAPKCVDCENRERQDQTRPAQVAISQLVPSVEQITGSSSSSLYPKCEAKQQFARPEFPSDVKKPTRVVVPNTLVIEDSCLEITGYASTGDKSKVPNLSFQCVLAPGNPDKPKPGEQIQTWSQIADAEGSYGLRLYLPGPGTYNCRSFESGAKFNGYAPVYQSFTIENRDSVNRKDLMPTPSVPGTSLEVLKEIESAARTAIAGARTDREKSQKLHDWLANYLTYYREKASSVVKQTGVPVNQTMDEVWKEKRGICGDYAEINCGLHRAVGIPCKVIVGDMFPMRHAWNEVLIDGKWWGQDVTFDDPSYQAGLPPSPPRQYNVFVELSSWYETTFAYDKRKREEEVQ